jgi:hypothetical protein
MPSSEEAVVSQKQRQKKWYEENKERVKAKARAHYEAHKEEAKAKMKENRARLRMAAIQHYGGKCACCGETEPDFLSIDHINNDGAEHRKKIGRDGRALYYWLRDNDYPEGFQALCYNCNLAKGLYGICPHQERRNES